MDKFELHVDGKVIEIFDNLIDATNAYIKIEDAGADPIIFWHHGNEVIDITVTRRA